MKRNIRRTLLIVFVAVFFVSMVPTAQAKGKDPQCTLAGVAGDYGFTDTGTVVGVGPFAAVGIFTLDAAGNVVGGKQTTSSNGSIAHLTFSGPYAVNHDCTGSTTLDVFDQSGNKLRTSTLDLVFVDNERTMRALFTSVVLPSGTSLGTVITVDAKKLFPETDNEQ